MKEETSPLDHYLNKLSYIKSKYERIIMELALEETANIKHITSRQHTVISLIYKERGKDTVQTLIQIEEDYKISRNLTHQQKLMEEGDALDLFRSHFQMKTPHQHLQKSNSVRCLY